MAFSATKRELGELYTFFRLLADGAVSLGTPKAEKAYDAQDYETFMEILEFSIGRIVFSHGTVHQGNGFLL